jgi:peptidoglycan hydrolase-like protein with peptidoglycan-binding domain
MPIQASVGDGGVNHRGDALYVQFLLNDWRSQNGLTPIAVDGLVGPETIAAIQLFQLQVTKIVDGRVDPAGPALQNLERLHMGVILDGIQLSAFQAGIGAIGALPANSPAITLDDAVALYFQTLRDNMD